MNKKSRIAGIGLFLAVYLLAGNSLAFAKDKNPPGFEKGQKKGWEESKQPSGWNKGEKKAGRKIKSLLPRSRKKPRNRKNSRTKIKRNNQSRGALWRSMTALKGSLILF